MTGQSPPTPVPPPSQGGGQGVGHDLYTRLTSRKFLMTVAAALMIVVAYAKGALPGPWAAATVTILTVAYTLVEGFIDASNT